MTVLLRSPRPADGPALAELLDRNRLYFASGEPLRPEAYYTPEHQTRLIEAAQAASDAGTADLFLIEADGALVGRANLNSIIRGAFQSASVGYVIDEASTGQGIATAALRQLVAHAFTARGLHRLQGETVVDNDASQRVLVKCGFTQYGTAEDYLRIGGRWHSCRLYQRINTAWEAQAPVREQREAR